MDFLPFDYMVWAKSHQGRYAFDLSVSGMAPPDADMFPLDPQCLTLQGVSAELRQQLKCAIAREYGVAASKVLLAAGTSEANYLVYGALVSNGDGVLVETPAYQALTRLPSVFGAHAIPFALRPDQRYALSVEAVQQAWRPGVKLVALTSPHNPSGFAASREALLALGDWLGKVDAYAVVDEVYRDFDPNPPPVAQALHPRLITTASLTKVYGLGSLRAGWALMPEVLVAKAEQRYDFMAVNPATTMLNLALSAFPKLAPLRARATQRAQQNRDLVAAWLSESKCFSAQLPPHGIIALLQLPPGVDDVALTQYLAEKQVLVAPGAYFGAPGTLRLAYGMESARLGEALERLEAGTRDYQKDIKT
ncbi:MAG: pyridoxal phosphate-dependent aminotransferase [Burkholderiales bacterium]|nr:pyridoxal phosphate-dependent aminotransferase [Burkholderiales bacterium]